MYSRRGPFETIGELGYLLYNAGKPWQTIRLIGKNTLEASGLADRSPEVLDRLTTRTNAPVRGLLNINTRQTNALAATLLDTPMLRTPYNSDANVPRLNLTQTRALTGYVASQLASDGPITNISQIVGRLDGDYIDANILDPADGNNKFFRESLIRNSIGLWSPRHQLYTIYVAARTFSDAYDHLDSSITNKEDYVTAEQRAVAVVWRDPLDTDPSNQGVMHKSYIQWFHWFHGAFWDE